MMSTYTAFESVNDSENCFVQTWGQRFTVYSIKVDSLVFDPLFISVYSARVYGYRKTHYLAMSASSNQQCVAYYIKQQYKTILLQSSAGVVFYQKGYSWISYVLQNQIINT